MSAGVGRVGDNWEGRGLRGILDVREDREEDSCFENGSEFRWANREVGEEVTQLIVVWNVLELELSYCLHVGLNALQPRIEVRRINEWEFLMDKESMISLNLIEPKTLMADEETQNRVTEAL